MRDFFTKKLFYGFFVSSLFSAIGLALANIADSLVVGMHIGEDGLVAIGITSPIYMLYAVFYIAIGTGGAVEFSRLSATEEKKSSVDLFSMMMMVSVAISIIFVIVGIFFTRQLLFLFGVSPADGEVYRLSFSYARVLLCAAPVFFINTPLYSFIRCDDAQKHSSLGFVTGNIIDVTLNVVFVLILNIGVTGTIWSTVIGQCVSILIYIPHFLNKKTLLRFRIVKPDYKAIFNTFATGFSVSVQFISQFVFTIAANHILLRIAGGYAVAVFDVVINVSYVGLCIHSASNEAMQPLTSMFFGEKNPVEQKRVLSIALGVGIAAGSLILAILALFAPSICSVYNANKALGTYAIRVYCFGAAVAGVNTIICGYFQSVGRSKLAFFITLLRSTVFLIAFAFVLGAVGVHAFWWLFPTSEILSLAVLFIANHMPFFRSDSTEVDEEHIFTFFIDSNMTDNNIPYEKIEAFCDKWGANFKQTYFVNMTVEEICGAIVENAFAGKKGVFMQITLISYDSGEFELHIRDNAASFNPFDLKTKQVSLEDTEEELNTLGVLMVKKKAKKFFYRRYQGLNTLIVSI